MRAAGKVPFYLALLIAGLSFAINVRYNGFVALYTDPAGYVLAGSRWASGDLQKPAPFQFQPQFPDFVNIASPMGFRPGAITGTDVGEYPLGLPVFIAAAVAAFGELGAYLIGPLGAALLAFCTYSLGSTLAGPWAGVVAAVLISASPVTVRHSVYVSSDVPCAAFWALAWLLSLTPRLGSAAAAGAAVTAAVMIRPNTAPLAAIIGLLILMGGASARTAVRSWCWRPALVFAALSAVGPAMLLWSNAMLFGAPLNAGYKGAADFFRWAHVPPNLQLYPSVLVEQHSLAAFLGLAAVPAALWKRTDSPASRGSVTMALSAVAVILLNFAIIVAFFPVVDWTMLRYLLPAMVALFVLFGGGVVWAAQRLARRSRLLTPLALIPIALVLWQGSPQRRNAIRDWQATHPVLLMGHYLQQALPANAVVLSYMHAGTVAHYAGRPIVRMDLMQPHLDVVIALLERAGYRPVMVLDELSETPHMSRVFPTSAFKGLDWPPRATFASFARIWYWDPADRQRHQSGQTYPTDVLR